MSKKISKDPLSDEQRKSLKDLHNNQITLEVALTIFVLSFLTINISSALPGYGVIAFLGIGISALLLIVCGTIFTSNVSAMKRHGTPLAQCRKDIQRWLNVVWRCIPAGILVLILAGVSKTQEFLLIFLVLFVGLVLAMLASIVLSLIAMNRIWKRFNKKKSSYTRIIAYGSIAFSLLCLLLLGSYTTTEKISYKTTPISDSNLELGQTEIKQAGKSGEKQLRHNLLLGIQMSSNTSNPIDEIIAKGTRRYQYMYCSNGSYYYFTAEQFKNPNVGYTHQSPDQCAQNGKGTQTTIADVPPPEKIVQQVPVYRTPTYTSPTYTTCRSYSFDNSISCTSY